MSEMKSLTLNDKTYDSFVDKTARSLSYGSAVIGSASGERFSVDDASNYNLLELHVYGKTTQAGTPTPDAPVELVNVGGSGSITVSVSSEPYVQSMTIATPNGLPGIPVSEGGNYTDANGQQWVCDEIDLARGVYVSRLLRHTPKAASSNVYRQTNYDGDGYYGWCVFDKVFFDCDNSMNNYPGLATSFLPANNNVPLSVNQFRMWADNGTLYYTLGTDNSEIALEVINSTEFLLVLDTPIEMPISAEELEAYAALHTYRDNTKVSNDAGAHMAMEYVIDAKKYIDKQIASSFVSNATVE